MDPKPQVKPEDGDLTVWLRQMTDGDPKAAESVAEAVYGELRHMAAGRLFRERRDHSLQPTLLVNEVFLRLLRMKRVNWNDRGHFFALAARLMRRIVVDYFRERNALKRPPRALQLTLDQSIIFNEDRRDEALMVDEALERFAQLDPRAAQTVELRYFGGLSAEQTAESLGVTVRTIHRDWAAAQAWLKDWFQSKHQ